MRGCRGAQLAGAELDALRHAAALHDIGKMAIPESILDKRGALSDTDWALIRQHTIIGERILAAAPAFEQSAKLVRSSHERMDGTGYPDGLAATDIPLGSRISSSPTPSTPCAPSAAMARHSPRPTRLPSCAAAPAPVRPDRRRRLRVRYRSQAVPALS